MRDTGVGEVEGSLPRGGQRRRLIAAAKDAFQHFTAGLDKSTGYLLGAGPSVAEADRYGLADGHVLVSNHLIGDLALMERLQPVAVCLSASPRFSGRSAEAQAFRAILIDRMRLLGLWAVTPLKPHALLPDQLPEDLAGRLITIPVRHSPLPLLDLSKRFQVPDRPHVMTGLMLPLAAALFQEIAIGGADGRADPAGQEPWPLFDGVTLSAGKHAWENYARYCQHLELACRALEQKGKRVVALTASHVPALRRRGAAVPLPPKPSVESEGCCAVVSLSPDLKDDVGHFGSYECRLSAAIGAKGCDYWTLAHRSWQRPPSFDERAKILPLLDTHSWSLGNKPDKSQSYRDQVAGVVAGEFSAGLDRILAESAGPLHVYFYCGSLEHAALLYEIASIRPRLSLHVNLFWLRSEETELPGFATKWAWLLRAAERDPRLTLTCMTRHQSDCLRRATGVALPVAAHPSPLIDDTRAEDLIESPRPDPPPQIFFPSTSRPEKGAGLLRAVAERIASESGHKDLELLFRTAPYASEAEFKWSPLAGRVRLLEGYIEEEVFIAALRGSSVVVLPYTPPNFANRTSGLIVDALYAGVPSVVVRGTFLAKIVERHGSGIVVEEATAEALAAAALKILKQGARSDFRAAARDYLQGNSWACLAAEILGTLPDKAYPGDLGGVPNNADCHAPVSLLGPVPRTRGARLNAQHALMACLDLAPQAERAAGEGIRLRRVAGADRSLSELVQGESCVLLVSTRAEDVAQALQVVLQHRPQAALLAFKGAPQQAEIAEMLDRAGYLVLVSERYPDLGDGRPTPFWRLVAYPFVSDLPWAEGDIIALPGSLSLRQVRETFTAFGHQTHYRPPADRRPPSPLRHWSKALRRAAGRLWCPTKT
ncbi:MAG: glycosyltransferase [Rhodospirillales bacterium]|nr:glycosyltransferase [Rhodospirillales bacterium]